MLQRLRQWIASRTPWWLALALTCAYWLTLEQGTGRIRFYALCAFPVIAALLVAAIDGRRRSTYTLLFAAALLPPAIATVAYAMAGRPPNAHACNPAPFLIAGWLVFAWGQVALMLFLALGLRSFGALIAQRRARAVNASTLEVDR